MEPTNIAEDFGVMILLSFACNASCNYCFQRVVQNDSSAPRLTSPPMSSVVIDQSCKFIDDRRHGKSVNLVLLGGEALLFADQCVRLIASMPALKTARLTTNGVLLTPALGERLVATGLDTAIITFDGARDDHNKTRFLAGGRGTYDVIVTNIAASEAIGLTTHLRVHVTPENLSGLPQLLRDLSDKINPSLHKIFFALVQDVGVGWKPNIKANSSEIEEVMIGLYRQSANLGFGVPVRTRVPCPFCQAGGLVIGPSGLLYPCEQMAGFDSCVVGNIWRGYDVQASAEHWGRCLTDRLDPDPDWREPLSQLDEALAKLVSK